MLVKNWEFVSLWLIDEKNGVNLYNFLEKKNKRKRLKFEHGQIELGLEVIFWA